MPRNSRPLVTAAVITGLVASFLVGRVTAQGPEKSSSPPSEANASPVVKKTILPDGSVQTEKADGTKEIKKPGKSGEPENTDQKLTEQDLIPASPPTWLTDKATNDSFLTAMRDYYGYKSSSLQHRSRVFQWQLSSSKFIFMIVLTLVTVGVVFAAIQFRIGLKRKTKDDTTEVEITPGSIKLSSSVLGVIILVISLAFFYLYLVYVYPISEIV